MADNGYEIADAQENKRSIDEVMKIIAQRIIKDAGNKSSPFAIFEAPTHSDEFKQQTPERIHTLLSRKYNNFMTLNELTELEYSSIFSNLEIFVTKNYSHKLLEAIAIEIMVQKALADFNNLQTTVAPVIQDAIWNAPMDVGGRVIKDAFKSLFFAATGPDKDDPQTIWRGDKYKFVSDTAKIIFDSFNLKENTLQEFCTAILKFINKSVDSIKHNKEYVFAGDNSPFYTMLNNIIYGFMLEIKFNHSHNLTSEKKNTFDQMVHLTVDSFPEKSKQSTHWKKICRRAQQNHSQKLAASGAPAYNSILDADGVRNINGTPVTPPPADFITRLSQSNIERRNAGTAPKPNASTADLVNGAPDSQPPLDAEDTRRRFSPRPSSSPSGSGN